MRYPDHDRYHARPDGAVPEAVRKVGRAPDPADGRATAGRFNSGHVHQGKRPYYGQAGAGNPASGSSLSDWLMERHLAARKDGQLNDALCKLEE